MTCVFLLPHGLVNTYCTGNGNIERLNNAHLRNNKITISHCNDIFTYTCMLIPKHECNTFSKINFMQTHSIAAEMCGVDLFVFLSQRSKTFFSAFKLMNG